MDSIIPSKKHKSDSTSFSSFNNDICRILLHIVKQALSSSPGINIQHIDDIKDGTIFLKLIKTLCNKPIEENRNQSVIQTISDFLNASNHKVFAKTIIWSNCEEGDTDELLRLLIFLLVDLLPTFDNPSSKPRKALNDSESLNTPLSQSSIRHATKNNASINRFIRSLSNTDQILIKNIFELAKEEKFQKMNEMLKESRPGSSKMSETVEYANSPCGNHKSPALLTKSPLDLREIMMKKDQSIKVLRIQKSEEEERSTVLIQQKEELFQENIILKKKVQEDQATIQQLKGLTSQLEEIDELKSKFELLTKENEGYKTKYGEYSRLKQDNPYLVTENKSLQVSVKELEDKCYKMEMKLINQDELMTSLNSLKEENFKLEKDIRQSKLQLSYEKEQVEELKLAIENYKERLLQKSQLNDSQMETSGELVSMVCSPFKGPTASAIQALEEDIERINKELSEAKALRENEQTEFECCKEKLMSQINSHLTNSQQFQLEISALKNEKEETTNEIKILSSKFKTLEEKANQLVVETQRYVKENLELVNVIASRDNDVATFQKDIDSLKEQISQSALEKVSLQELLQKMHNDHCLIVEEKESTISQNENEIHALNSVVKRLNDEITEFKNIAKGLELDIDRDKNEIYKLTDQLNDEKMVSSDLQSQYNEIQIARNDLETQFQHTKDELQSLKEILTECERRDHEHHSAFAQLQEAHGYLRKQHSELESKCKEVEEGKICEVQRLNEEIAGLKSVAQNNEDTLKELKSEKEELIKKLDQQAALVIKLSEEKDSIVVSYENIIEQKNVLKLQQDNVIKSLGNENDAMKLTSQEHLSSMEALNSKIRELNEENKNVVKQLNDNLGNFNQKEQDLKAENHKLALQLDDLRLKNEELVKTICSLENTLKSEEEKKNLFEQKCTSSQEEIALLKIKVSECQSKITNLIDEKNDSVCNYNNTLIGNSQNILQLRDEVSKSEAVINTLKIEIADSSLKLQVAKENESLLNQEINSLKAKEQAFESLKENLLQEISDIKSQEEKLNNEQERVQKELTQENEMLLERLCALNKQVEELQLANNNVSSEKDSLKSSICLLKDEISTANNEVSSLQLKLREKDDVTLCKDNELEILKKEKLAITREKEESHQTVIEKDRELDTLKSMTSTNFQELDSRVSELSLELEAKKKNEKKMENQIQSLQNQFESLQKSFDLALEDTESYLHSIDGLKVEVSSKESIIQELNANVSSLKENLSVKDGEISSLKNEQENKLKVQLEDLIVEREELVILLEVLKEEKKSFIEKLKDKDELLSKTTDEKQQLLNETSQILSKVSSLEEEVTKLHSNFGEKIKEIKGRQTNFQELLKKLRQVEQLKAQLEGKVNTLQSELDKEKKTNEEFKNMETILKEANANLHSNLIATKSSSDENLMKIEQMDKLCQQTLDNNAKLRDEIKVYKFNLDHAKSSLVEIDNIRVESQNKLRKFDLLEEANANLIGQIKNFRNQKIYLEDQLALSKSIISKLEMELGTKQTERDVAEESLQSELETFREKERQLQLENNKLIEENSKLQNEYSCKTEELHLAKSVVNDLQLKLGSKEKEFAANEQTFKSKITFLKERLNKMVLENNTYVSDASEMKLKIKCYENNNCEVLALRKEKSSLKGAVDDLEKDKNQLHIDIFNLQEENGHLKKHIEELQEKLNRIEIDDDKYKSLCTEKDKLMEELTMKEQEEMQFKEAQSLKIQHLEEKSSYLQKNLEVSENKVQNLKLNVEKLMLDKTSVLEEFHKIQAEKTNLSKEKGGLEKEWCQHFEKLKSENDELRGDNCKLAQRVVDLKKQCQTYKDKCSKLQNNFETTEKKYLEEMREVYVSVQEKIEQRDKDSAEEILKLQRKYESNEESYNEMKNQVKVFKQLLDQKAKVIDSQKEGINHLKFEIAKLKFRILDLGAKETTELKDWTRRFSCIGDIDSMSSLPDYNSAVTRGHLRMDSSALPGTPGNSSTVSGFTCEEEEGHFNDHSKNLSHLIAGICEADDKNRLLELQRRNTLCAPHLKTTYPVETQTWSASKDPNKLASQVKKQQKADKAILNKKMPVRKSERLSNSNLEISYVEPKRKRVKKDILLNTPTPDKRTKSFWRKSAATPECSYDASEASTSTGKKRSWKKPIKEFLTPSKGKTFKVPKSRFNAN